VRKTRDASNRLLPPKRSACTRISCVPGFLSRLSPCGHPAESKALRGSTGGPNGSRRSDRFGGLSLTQHRRCSRSSACLVRSASRLSGHERGRFLPTARRPIEPLTSLSLLPVHPVVHVTFVRALRPSSCWAFVRSVVVGKPPSLLSTPTRDDRCFRQTGMPSLGKDPS
jgi:hypothetical protein